MWNKSNGLETARPRGFPGFSLRQVCSHSFECTAAKENLYPKMVNYFFLSSFPLLHSRMPSSLSTTTNKINKISNVNNGKGGGGKRRNQRENIRHFDLWLAKRLHCCPSSSSDSGEFFKRSVSAEKVAVKERSGELGRLKVALRLLLSGLNKSTTRRT